MSDSALADLLFAGHKTSSGVDVDVATAFTVSAVYDAVNQISSDVAKLPLNLHKRRSSGGSDIYSASPVQRLLKLEPNPEMGSMVFRRQIMVWALTAKGGFAEIQRNGMGQPVALWPIHPSRVTPYRARLRDGGYGPLSYQIDGGKTTIAPEDMIHIAGIGDDPHCAYPLVEKARQAIGLALAAEQFGATFFGNGSTFGGILTTDIMPTEEEAKRMKVLIEQIHKGPERAHQLAALWGGWKLQPLGVKPNEGQMNELRAKQVEEVARFYRLQPYRLGLNTPGTVSYSSVEMAQLDYYQGCLLDWITQWEQELNRKLVPRLEQNQQFIKHNANAFLRGDIKSRYEALGIARDKGIINANEWRDLDDMNPQEGEQGTQYLVQQAQVPADRIGKLADADVKKKEKDAKDDPPPVAPAPQPSPDGGGAALVDKVRELDDLIAQLRSAAGDIEVKLATHQVREQAEMDADKAELERLKKQELAFVGLVDSLRGEVALLTTKAESDARAAEERQQALQQAADTAAHAASEAETLAQASMAEVARRQELLDQATAKAEESQRSLLAEEAGRAALQAELEAAVSQRQASVLALESLQAEHGASVAAIEAAELDRRQWATRFEELSAVCAASKSAVDEMAAALEVSRAEAAAASVDLHRRQAELAASEQAATDARRQADEMARALETTREELDRTAKALASAQSMAEAVVQQQVQSDAERESVRTALETRATAAEQAAEEANERLQASKSSQSDGVAAIIAAHRALVSDIMRRMMDREAERIQTKAHLPPQKALEAIEKFYDGHADLCRRSLLPAVAVHVAFVRSSADAGAVTDALVAAHVAESKRLVAHVLEDRDDPAPALSAMFRRWDIDRVSQIADRLMQEELDYVRKQ